MLDLATLRVTFGLVALCVVVLFYGVSYRTTRSDFSAWWCISLACLLPGSMLYLFNGTALQAFANPLGNTLGVLGAAAAWAGGRSLRGRDVRWWEVATVPAAVLLLSASDDPAHDVWAGGTFYLIGIAALVLRSAWEIWCAARQEPAPVASEPDLRLVLQCLAVGSAFAGLYYLGRSVVFAFLGRDHLLFRTVFGGEAATMVLMLLLVVVSFGMAALSQHQLTSELRERATTDPLTGVLNRSELLHEAQRAIDALAPGVEAAMVMADLDRFKSLNDGFGHAAGDRALTEFAAACQDVVGDDGLVGRLGGDEFVLCTSAGDDAEDVVADILRRYVLEDHAGTPERTASVGIAAARRGDDVTRVLARADSALYRAKRAGRNRVVRYDDGRGPSTRRQPV